MRPAPAPRPDLAGIAARVWRDAEVAGFRGYDPYDGLHTRALAPLLDRSRLMRLVIIQGVKRSPLNLRPLLRVRPGMNPKGLALFLGGAAELPSLAGATGAREWLADALVCLASRPDGSPARTGREVTPGAAARLAAGDDGCEGPLGWGYHFPWQAVAFLQPPHYPTVVGTSFVLDAFAASHHAVLPRIAEGAARFVLEALNLHRDADGVCFSYSPRDRSRVYNASLFAAKILARAASLGGPAADERAALARAAADWVVARQRADGAWLYGEAAHWQWIDGLHTGFVLETLGFLGETLGVSDWDDAITRGLAWYRANLFGPGDEALYYPARPYPLDPHTCASAALTLLALRRHAPDGAARARAVLERGAALLWSDRRGVFVTRRSRLVTDRTPYLRWSQAWMFRALSAQLAREASGS